MQDNHEEKTVRAAWERPALVRMDAADAEMMNGVGADQQGGTMMNS